MTYQTADKIVLTLCVIIIAAAILSVREGLKARVHYG